MAPTLLWFGVGVGVGVGVEVGIGFGFGVGVRPDVEVGVEPMVSVVSLLLMSLRVVNKGFLAL